MNDDFRMLPVGLLLAFICWLLCEEADDEG